MHLKCSIYAVGLGGGLDLLGLGRFLISVELVLELEANVKLPLDSEAGISGPQSG